jgi:hypothetical protein
MLLVQRDVPVVIQMSARLPHSLEDLGEGHEKAGMLGTIALPHDYLIGSEVAGDVRERENRAALFVVKRMPALQLAQHRLQDKVGKLGQFVLPGRGSTLICLSATSHPLKGLVMVSP